MSGVFTPRMEILPPAQQRLWPALRPAAQLGFALYGGTAIALRLGHRASVDFDFFTEKPLDRGALDEAFPFMGQALVLQDEPNALSVLVADASDADQQVKLSFFGTIGFGRVGAPDSTEDGVLQVASLDDLMATKVKVVLQRVEAKDYRDIAAMVSAGVSLAKGLATARAMFGPRFQPNESLKAITYFKGGDLHTLRDSEKACLVNATSVIDKLPMVAIVHQQLTKTI